MPIAHLIVTVTTDSGLKRLPITDPVYAAVLGENIELMRDVQRLITGVSSGARYSRLNMLHTRRVQFALSDRIFPRTVRPRSHPITGVCRSTTPLDLTSHLD